MEGCSGPNTTGVPTLPETGALRIVTWNCRGLLQSREDKRALCLGHLKKFSANKDIICLQEVHGTQEELIAEMESLRPGCAVFHSP